jgi:regulator of protease activity HflC (stomatin/prohibitin superfamily)
MKTIEFKNIAVFLILSILIASCSMVKPGSHGMMYSASKKGLKSDKVYEDGAVWHWPWNQVITYNLQWQSYQEKIAVLTADELHITITASLTMRPMLSELPQLELEVGQDYYNSIVKPSFYTVTRSVIANYSHNSVSPKSLDIEAEILEGIKKKCEGKYLEFDIVSIDHIMYSPLVTEAVDQKLSVKQEIEQKDFEMQIAEKDAEIQRIRARGQRDSQQIIASGLTSMYLQYKALEVQDKLSDSENTKFYFIPTGQDGLPIIVDTNDN